MSELHRVRVDVLVSTDGSARAPFPTYYALSYDGDSAWISIPAEHCPCAYPDAAAHQAAMRELFPALDVEACVTDGHIIEGAPGPADVITDVKAPTRKAFEAAQRRAKEGKPATLRAGR